jgi:hypothetical protein
VSPFPHPSRASKGPRAVGLVKKNDSHLSAGGGSEAASILVSPRLGPPVPLTLSALQRTASNTIGMGSYGASLVPEDQLHFSSLSSTLRALLAVSTSPAVVGSNGHKVRVLDLSST